MNRRTFLRCEVFRDRGSRVINDGFGDNDTDRADGAVASGATGSIEAARRPRSQADVGKRRRGNVNVLTNQHVGVFE